MRKFLTVIVYLFACIGLVFTLVFIGMQFGLLNVRGGSIGRNAFFLNARGTTNTQSTQTSDSCSTCAWYETSEWDTVRAGLQKDMPVIQRVSQETGVPARLIVALAVPEQLRFFTAEREVFKRYFEPLKILGTLSQFSLGITGIKPETAVRIEEYAASTTSPWYPGTNPLTPAISDNARFERLTDEHDHYYQWLYTALFIKEIRAEWSRAGFEAALTPGIYATLFNLGFDHSRPSAAPVIGGAEITVGKDTLTYGALAEAFYKSSKLREFAR